MFDELMRELRRLEKGVEIAVPVAADGEGYLDRECPSPECLSQFKVHEDDWKDKVRSEEAFCVFCGHAADSQKWLTQEQVEHVRKAGLADIDKRVSNAMARDARRWNQQQRKDSFVSITMQVDSRPQTLLLPPAAAEPMRLKIVCGSCACRYAAIGAAFFCPACGHNSADLVFDQSITGIGNVLTALPAVRTAIPDRDDAERMARQLIESGLQNAVTSFQRYAEFLYARFPSAPKARRNAFQNLTEGSDLWHAATGKRYSDYLDAPELSALTRLFQQRHLLAHTQGLVDQDYLDRTGDTAYRVGQRIVVREAAVRECLALIQKLIGAMI